MTDQNRKQVTFEDLNRRDIIAHVKPYFDWIRHIVTLSLGALTALVALQGHYIPRQPTMKLALVACWACLLATILLGLLALREEYSGPLRQMANRNHMRKALGDQETARRLMAGSRSRPSCLHRWSVHLIYVTFPTALSSLCVFAIANLLA